MAKFRLSGDERVRLDALCKKYGVVRLRLFGSAANGEYIPGTSDLDFLVSFASPPPGISLARQYFGFHEELKTLLKSDVDLLEDCAIRNRFLRAQAESEAVLFYGS